MAAQWFKQDLFEDPNLLGGDEDEEEEQPAGKKAKVSMCITGDERT